MDSTFRALDTETGRELWHIGLPASAIATPMTYRARLGGPQYVVVAVGGHGKAKGIKLGDYVMAFVLP
jgi:quinoprotein glucose dehydrogenase